MFPPSPILTPTATPANGFGLKGEYYDNSDLTNLKIIRNDPYVSFYWGIGSPDASIGGDTFSIRWTGQVQPRYSETYTFKTATDDGVRLWVNNQQIINNWTAGGTYTGTIALTAGVKYDIKMEYKENVDRAGANLYWSSWTQPEQIIPQSQLFSPLPTPTPTSAYWAGLVGFWNFNDGTGADSSGHGHNLYVGGNPIDPNGASGSGLGFYGTAIYVNYHSDFDPTNGFTLSSWLNPSQLTGSTWRTAIFSRYEVGKGDLNGLYFDVNGNLKFEVNGLSPNSITGPQLQVNQWSLVTVVYDKNGGQIRLYVNGDLVSAANVTGTASNNTSVGLSIGGAYPMTYYQGKMDEIHFYNRPLTSGEIQQFMSLFPTPTPIPSQTPTSIPTPLPTVTAGEFGTGADGDVTVTSTYNIHTTSLTGRSCADAVSYSITQLYGNTAVLSGESGCRMPCS